PPILLPDHTASFNARVVHGHDIPVSVFRYPSFISVSPVITYANGILATLQHGQALTVVGRASNYTDYQGFLFYEIELYGRNGFVPREFIIIDTPPAPLEFNSNAITTNRVNLYANIIENQPDNWIGGDGVRCTNDLRYIYILNLRDIQIVDLQNFDEDSTFTFVRYRCADGNVYEGYVLTRYIRLNQQNFPTAIVLTGLATGACALAYFIRKRRKFEL
ncbi:MAG: hypothetical protein FWB72_04895, partial [Firmicutes bacterium]|nr:hypothetical protein [Bacillota bacterium]